MPDESNSNPKTFTDFLRHIFHDVLFRIGSLLNRLGIRPSVITYTGLIGNIISGALIAFGELTFGGLVAFLAGPLDALDGTMARLRGEDSRYGAFIDSVTDRYSELALYSGLLIYFVREKSWQNIFLVFFAAVGSIMVSYIRARAESVQYEARVGLLTRVERYVVLIPGIIFQRPEISLWILAVLTHLTAIQRFIHVTGQVKKKMKVKTNKGNRNDRD